MIWLSKFVPALMHADLGGDLAGARPLTAAIAASLTLAAAFALARRRERIRDVVVVFTAGFAAMVMESVLLLYYQATHGILFQNIGALLTMFMAGLAAGAAAVRLRLKCVSNPVNDSPTRRHRSRWLGPALFAGFAAVTVLFVGGLRLGVAFDAASISLLLFASGFFVSGVFAWVSLERSGDQRLLVSPLYGADLIGGCVGSLLAGLFLLPFLGIEVSAGLVAVVSTLCLLIV
jgi:hypothetical protein